MPKPYAQQYTPEYRDRMLELGRAAHCPDDLSKEVKSTAQSICNWVARNAGRRWMR